MTFYRRVNALYTISELKAILNAYIAAKSLVNPHHQQFINVGDLLRTTLSSNKAGEASLPDFLKREDALRKLADNMQPWHRVVAEGGEPVTK